MNYKLLLPFILLCTSCSISAEERWFEIELLLFKRNTDIKMVEEDLIVKNIILDTSKSIELLKSEAVSQRAKVPLLISNTQFASSVNGFQLLDNTQLQLSGQREKLQRHASFEPLLHLAWRMPVRSKKSALPIHLFAGNNYANISDSLVNVDETSASKTIQVMDNPLISAEGMSIAEKATEYQADKWSIDGLFKIYLEHYLFIDSQLLVRQATTEAIATDATLKQAPQFELIEDTNDVQIIKQQENAEPVTVQQKTVISEALFDQNRRLRSEEIHYFDHPLMGIIVQIRKIPAQELAEMLQSPQDQPLTE